MKHPSQTAVGRLRRGTPREVGMSAARLKTVASLIRQWVDEGVAQTIEVLVARRGKIVLHDVSGKLTPEPNSPRTLLNAIFPLASITKVLTATALMTLVDEGRVGLNRPVFFYIPEFKGEGKDKVLVRHLLTHTSGIREEELEKYASEQKGRLGLLPTESTIHPLAQEVLFMRYGAPLWKTPGSEMSYCGFNFNLAGEIVRRVSGASLDGFANSRIFKPLGMVDTHYSRVDAPASRCVRRPPDPPDPLWDAITDAMENERMYFGSFGAVSTAMDVAILGQMFLNGGSYGPSRILSSASVAEMTRNQIPGVSASFMDEFFPEASWGLGWSVHGDKTGLAGGLLSSKSYEHGGAGGTYVWVDPELELVGVYFSSTNDSTTITDSLKYWRNDLFTDAVTAAIEDL